MAGFRTHIEVASVASAVFATGVLGAQLVTPKETVMLWAAGSIGGILPDIDSDNSTSISLIFGLISLFVISLLLINLAFHLSIIELWLAVIATALGINYGVRPIFAKFTVHRGIFHSLLSGVLFLFITTALSYHVLGFVDFIAWMLGIFVFFRFVTHLTLDEIYSVDFMNIEIKRSFGSALKPIDHKNWINSLIMMACIIGLFFITPDISSFTSVVFTEETKIAISENFLPIQYGWWWSGE